MNTKHSKVFTVYPDMCNYMTTGDNKPMVHGGYMLMMMDRCAAECSRRLLYDSKKEYFIDKDQVKHISEYIKFMNEMYINDIQWHSTRGQTSIYSVKDLIDESKVDSNMKIGADSALTVNVTDVTFFIGAALGDIIFLNAEVVKLGTKRIEIQVTGERENSSGKREKICEGKFIFCAMYQNKYSIPHGLKL